MPRHQDDGLPHKEQEQTPYERHYQHQYAKQQQAAAEYLVDHALPVKACKKLIGAHVFGGKVQRLVYDLGRQQVKKV